MYNYDLQLLGVLRQYFLLDIDCQPLSETLTHQPIIRRTID